MLNCYEIQEIECDVVKENDEKIYHEHDVGYKYIFSHKGTFIELLKSFVKKKWVNLLQEEDLVLVDKSYILSDFDEEESDIVYRINTENREIIFYILLEFQSRIDFQMPMRLLFYMTEIWRDILKNSTKKDRRRKGYRLPAVVPIVIYNGKNSWTASKSFKEVLKGHELIEENLVDFNYILLDINRFNESELLEVANLVSAVFLLDQDVDERQLIRRLRKIVYILKRIKPEQFDIFKQWLKGIIKPRLSEDISHEIEETLNSSNQMEVEYMVYNLQRTLERLERRGKEEGIREGIKEGIKEGENKKALQIAKNLLAMGMDVLKVIEVTGLTEEEVYMVRESMN